MKSGFHGAEVVATGVNSDAYHAVDVPRGTINYPMSPSSLKSFAECAQRFLLGYQPPASEAKAWGSLIDCCILTPGQFDSRYAVRPATYTNEKGDVRKWNGNANICKEWKAERDGLEILSPEEFANSGIAAQRLYADPLISSLLSSSDRQVHVQGFWHDAPTGLDVPVRCLIDLVPKIESEWAKCLADLKTTRNGSLGAWLRFAFQLQVHVQAAFDLDLYCAATGEDRNTWLFVLQENYPPYEPGKRMLSQQFIDLGRRRYQAYLSAYAQCLKSESWAGYDEHSDAVQGWSLMVPLSYMELDDWSFAISQQEEPEDDPDQDQKLQEDEVPT